MTLTKLIKDQAMHLGFSLVGVTSPAPLPHEDVFTTWLDLGRHAEMTYLNSNRSRECRANPQRILPECRSVLVLGTRYSAPLPYKPGSGSGSPFGSRIAAYACGEDYHDVLSRRLASLVEFIEAQVGQPIPNRRYTDTGPILERELAQRAGLGWIGKNTCLISPTQGSYLFLAEILLGIELEPDVPFLHDRCGTCQRCVNACPTGCISSDRTLDARRCISYLTIELKGSIPSELRPKMDGWVFGCDICQEVCPWNRFAGSMVDEAFYPLGNMPEPALIEQLHLSAAEFNRKFRHSPIRRAKRRGYLRNLAVALGNQHRDEAVPGLVQVLMSEPEPLVRLHTAWALGQIGGEIALHALQTAYRTEADEGVKLEIQSAVNAL